MSARRRGAADRGEHRQAAERAAADIEGHSAAAEFGQSGWLSNNRSQFSLNANHILVRGNVGILLARGSHTIKLPRPLFVLVGAAYLARCSMRDGHLFATEIMTAAIFAMLIYAAFLPLTN
jgi:hypothetical protein